jgi:hypothetical protein
LEPNFLKTEKPQAKPNNLPVKKLVETLTKLPVQKALI